MPYFTRNEVFDANGYIVGSIETEVPGYRVRPGDGCTPAKARPMPADAVLREHWVIRPEDAGAMAERLGVKYSELIKAFVQYDVEVNR